MNEDLHELGEEYWAWSLRTNPTTAHALGIYDHAAEVEDASRDAEDTQIESLDSFATRAASIDPASLTEDERVSREVLMFESSSAAAELRTRKAEFAVDPTDRGIQLGYLTVAPQLPIPDADTAQAMVVKWSRLGSVFDQAADRLRQGVARGRTPPAEAVDKAVAQIDKYLALPVERDPLVNLNPPASFEDEQVDQWRNELSEQVRDVVRPAYVRYLDVLRKEVAAQARPQEKSGVVWLADGAELYTTAISQHTSLPLSGQGIHATGLEEIERLGHEYRELGDVVLGTSDLDEIYSRLRDDQTIRFQSAEEIVEAAQHALDRAAEAMPDWFGRLPQAACVMAEIPALAAKDAPLAFYFPPATDGSRPGTYFVNTSEPTTRTKYEAEALAFHESIPGHHLQLTIAQELVDTPMFRRNAFITVFHEGWGLYTERLADEMGLYSGDLERMGVLSFDSWRAGRLVVDTGIHVLGWSRREAIDYLVANSPQALNNVVNEVDRYIAWPGQALAYKTGQLEMLAARQRALDTMGDRFDIKGFHDALLGAGSTPMTTMHRRIDEWARS